MNRLTCSEPDLGQLLHAYEIGALTDDDTERFENHLLSCDACLHEVRRFQHQAHLLRDDPQIRADVSRVVRTGGSGTTSGWRSYLWPRIPIVLRPAVLLALCALMLYPAIIGMEQLLTPGYEVATDYFISSAEFRSSDDEPLVLIDGVPSILRFPYSNPEPGPVYTVTLTETESGTVCFRETHFDFRGSRRGVIQLQPGFLQPKEYTLTVGLTDDASDSDVEVYTFTTVSQDKHE